MSSWEHRHKRPYQYRSKLIADGTVKKVKELREQGKTFAEIGNIIGKSRQQASQIYYKTVAKRNDI